MVSGGERRDEEKVGEEEELELEKYNRVHHSPFTFFLASNGEESEKKKDAQPTTATITTAIALKNNNNASSGYLQCTQGSQFEKEQRVVSAVWSKETNRP